MRAQLDGEVLKAIDDAQIDILVDLAGHTRNARLSLFAARPPPIVVNYLGFAGTSGSKELFHYIIADQIVLPDQNSQFCDEKIVRLPGSFMPRENHVGTMDDAAPNRADHDLRQEWTVFCCSNNAYKINPAVFGSWMKILKSVDQSVVWLSDVGEIAKSNLRKEAKGRGVDPRLMVRPARSRGLERGESPVDSTIRAPRPTGGRLHGCAGPVPELLTADEAPRKS